MAGYYALRLFQHSMHGRKRDDVESKEIPLREGAIVGALVACIVALALHPNFILRRIDPAATQVAERTSGGGHQTSEDLSAARNP